MNKALVRATTAITAVIALTALSACSDSDETTTATTAEETTSAETAVEETPADTETETTTQDDYDAEQAARLEAMVEEGRKGIPSLLESMDGAYSEIEFLAEGDNTVHYVYTYADPVDVEEAVAHFEENISTLQDDCDTNVFPVMKGQGIPDPLVRYTYINADGTEVWTALFEPSA
ncbi:MAG: hypothetical protein ACK5KO_11165 [Arachnia sp.]